MTHQFLYNFVTRLYGIDTEITIGVPNEVAVKIVTVRLGKPRPGENICQDLTHPYLLAS
jgi:hypothetical protein